MISPHGMLAPEALKFGIAQKRIFWWAHQRRALERAENGKAPPRNADLRRWRFAMKQSNPNADIRRLAHIRLVFPVPCRSTKVTLPIEHVTNLLACQAHAAATTSRHVCIADARSDSAARPLSSSTLARNLQIPGIVAHTCKCAEKGAVKGARGHQAARTWARRERCQRLLFRSRFALQRPEKTAASSCVSARPWGSGLVRDRF
jgi:hypothetical protein